MISLRHLSVTPLLVPGMVKKVEWEVVEIRRSEKPGELIGIHTPLYSAQFFCIENQKNLSLEAHAQLTFPLILLLHFNANELMPDI